jgi:rhodanese-related sulfurtransferase
MAPEEFAKGHIPRAVNIPMDRVKELAPRLLPNKDAQIVTYCMNEL